LAVYNRRSTISACSSRRDDQSLGSSKKARANHRKWPDRPIPVVKIGSPCTRRARAAADIANSRNNPNSSISKPEETPHRQYMGRADARRLSLCCVCSKQTTRDAKFLSFALFLSPCPKLYFTRARFLQMCFPWATFALNENCWNCHID